MVCGCALCNFGVSQCVSEFEKHGRSGANRPAQNVCLAALSEEADHEISLGVSAFLISTAACMADQCEWQFRAAHCSAAVCLQLQYVEEADLGLRQGCLPALQRPLAAVCLLTQSSCCRD